MPTSEDATQKLIAVVHGDVHGIGFRANTKNNADLLGITGFVENRDDGTVYVEAFGTKGRLLALLDFLRIGPSNATVESVDDDWSEASENPMTTFEIR